MDEKESEHFDLYEGLDNFEDSSQEDVELEEQKEVPESKVDVDAPEEDDFSLVVDDEGAAPVPTVQEQKPARKSARAFVYTRKDRSFFIGAPAASEISDAPMGNIEFFVILNNLPGWLDGAGLRSYVEGVGAGVLFCKVLYNLYNGAPLGLGFLEFSDISQCTAFLNHKSQIVSNPMPPKVFAQLMLCREYRLGVVSESFIKSVCRHFSVPYSTAKINSISQLDLIETEFERQQAEMVKNGEFEMITRAFPWFNFDLVAIMGNCGRLIGHESENATHFQSYSKMNSGLEHSGKVLPLLGPQVLGKIKDDPNVEKIIDRKLPAREGKAKKQNSGEARARNQDSESKRRERSVERGRSDHAGKDKSRSQKRQRARDRSRERPKEPRHKSPQRNSNHKSSHRR